MDAEEQTDRQGAPPFVEVAVDRPDRAGEGGLVLTYRLPPGMVAGPGHLALVPLGGRVIAGIIVASAETAPVAEDRVLEVLRLVDPTPALTPDQMALGRWIASYYHCSLYTALALMLPPGLSSQEVITYRLTDAARALSDAEAARLNPRQRRALGLLQTAGGVLTSGALRARLADADAVAVARRLEKRGLVERHAALLRPRVAPRQELFARALPAHATARLGAVQQAALAWLAAPAPARAPGAPPDDGWRPARALYQAAPGATRQTLTTLATHGLVALEERAVWRDPLAGAAPPDYAALALTPRQGQVWQALAEAIEATHDRPLSAPSRAFLLHGVTGSGKTEVYLRAIGLALRLGRQAIVLVPEIALTPQTMHRFAGRFPGRVALLHSRLSDGERYDQWRQIRDGRFDIVVGSRSAVFAPLPRLGLIILDEEHEWSYKQDSTPFYHTRDVALRRAALTGAVVTLGSATPDVTTYYQASRPPEDGPTEGVTWRLLRLPARVGVARAPDGSEMTTELPMPPVRLVDMRQELRAGNRSIFSVPLQRALEQTIHAGEQAILFLNRRGSRTFVLCRSCGFVPLCPDCDIPLVYHADIDLLVCHRCDLHRRQPHPCPRCGSPGIKRFGAGTQRVEEEMRRLFPAARVLRWDRDTAARKGAHDSLLGAFMRHEADVLVGTQMIAKGLDLPLVTLVGVDQRRHRPAPARLPRGRAHLPTAHAGGGPRRAAHGRRAGHRPDLHARALRDPGRRAPRLSRVLPARPRFRLTHGYPPFSRMAKLVHSAEFEAACQIEAKRLAEELRARAEELGLRRRRSRRWGPRRRSCISCAIATAGRCCCAAPTSRPYWPA